MEYFENELFKDNWHLTASNTEGIFQNEHCYEAKIPIYQLLKDCRRNVVMWLACFFQALYYGTEICPKKVTGFNFDLIGIA